MRRYISIDAETNGLRGEAFSIAGVAMENGEEISRFVGRCPINGEINEWVKENVLPGMEEIEITHKNYKDLLEAFITWHKEFPQWNVWDNKHGFQTLWHMGHIIEAKLFDDAYKRGLIGEFDSPYCPLELSSYLQASGFLPDSVDSYMCEARLRHPTGVGRTYNPLHDAHVTSMVYEHLIS